MASIDNFVSEKAPLELAGYALNRQLQTIQVNSQLIRLRSKLWQVLQHLVENSNQLVTRQSLIENCWNGNNYTGEQGLTHTICHLRRIIKTFDISACIVTIPKRGYVLQEDLSLSIQKNIGSFTYSRARNLNKELLQKQLGL